jgi:hypothetical protein
MTDLDCVAFDPQAMCGREIDQDKIKELLAAMWEVRPYVIDDVKQGHEPTPSMRVYDDLLRKGLDLYTPSWANSENLSGLLIPNE